MKLKILAKKGKIFSNGKNGIDRLIEAKTPLGKEKDPQFIFAKKDKMKNVGFGFRRFCKKSQWLEKMHLEWI